MAESVSAGEAYLASSLRKGSSAYSDPVCPALVALIAKANFGRNSRQTSYYHVVLCLTVQSLCFIWSVSSE